MRIGRRILATFQHLGATYKLVQQIEGLTEHLSDEKDRADDWGAQLEDLQKRYDSFRKAEEIRAKEALETMNSLKADIDRLVGKLGSKDASIAALVADRDALFISRRLLVGQLDAAGLRPDFPEPALRSIPQFPIAEAKA
jgi:predicted RNase H-like nuclease (RuvC/YqgF family)